MDNGKVRASAIRKNSLTYRAGSSEMSVNRCASQGLGKQERNTMARSTARLCFAILGGALLLVVVILVWKAGDAPATTPFSVSRETTYITEPVDKDGFVDYVAALNDKLSTGVSKENNAVALLCEVFGPKLDNFPLQPEFYKRLGITEPPNKGAYLVSFSWFLNTGVAIKPNERKRLLEAEDELRRRPWKAADFPRAAAWLEAMAAPISVGVEATHRSHYYYPLIPEHGVLTLRTAPVPLVQECRVLGNALAVRAMWHLGQGRSEAAWHDLAACYRLARLVSGGGTLPEGLVGMALERTASDATLALLETGRHDGKLLRRAWSDWRALPSAGSVRASVNLTERYTMLQMVLLMQRYGLDILDIGKKRTKAPKPEPMQGVAWDPALKNINATFDHIDTILKQEDYHARRDAIGEFVQDLQAQAAEFREPDVLAQAARLFATPEERGERIGDILVCLLLSAFDRVQEAQERAEQLRQGIDVAFALAAYRVDHGNYPEQLAGLSPGYLEKIPADRFTGKPLIYRPQPDGYVFYSFGVNERDDEGRTAEDEPPGDDIVVRMPPRARRQ
jgi:hypothetical protein